MSGKSKSNDYLVEQILPRVGMRLQQWPEHGDKQDEAKESQRGHDQPLAVQSGPLDPGAPPGRLLRS